MTQPYQYPALRLHPLHIVKDLADNEDNCRNLTTARLPRLCHQHHLLTNDTVIIKKSFQ